MSGPATAFAWLSPEVAHGFCWDALPRDGTRNFGNSGAHLGLDKDFCRYSPVEEQWMCDIDLSLQDESQQYVNLDESSALVERLRRLIRDSWIVAVWKPPNPNIFQSADDQLHQKLCFSDQSCEFVESKAVLTKLKSLMRDAFSRNQNLKAHLQYRHLNERRIEKGESGLCDEERHSRQILRSDVEVFIKDKEWCRTSTALSVQIALWVTHHSIAAVIHCADIDTVTLELVCNLETFCEADWTSESGAMAWGA